MGERLRFQAASDDPAPFAPYLEALRKMYINGGALLCCFNVPRDPVFDWFALGRNTLEGMSFELDGIDFFTQFLGSAGVRAGAKELQIPDPLRLPDTTTESTFRWAFPLCFEGDRAQILFQGGAYAKFTGTAAEAKGLAQQFTQARLGDRYEDFLIDASFACWSPWFGAIAWDGTSTLFDKKFRRIWLLCSTDTDGSRQPASCATQGLCGPSVRSVYERFSLFPQGFAKSGPIK